MYLFTKEKSQVAKGICILIMLAHHLYAFPERIDYIYDIPFWVRLGNECGIIVGLYVFISGYGMGIKPLTLQIGGGKILKLWLSFLLVFITFIPLGLILGIYQFEIRDFLLNVFFIHSTYNHEWWFFSLYIKLMILTCILSYCKNNYVLGILAVLLSGSMLLAYRLGLTYVTLDLKLYLPVFLLGYCTRKFSLFELTEKYSVQYLSSKYIRIVLYTLIAIVLGHKFRTLGIVQFFFWFLALSLVDIPNWLIRFLSYLSKYSLNMWLVHTFFCYYYCKDLFKTIGNPVLGYVLLFTLSLFTSILLDKVYRLLLRLSNDAE